MDIRVVETMPTSGVMTDSQFRIDPSIEVVSLDYDETDGSLTLVDYNLNYSLLPWQLGTDLVKKTFLTYNGYNCETAKLYETVVMESGSGAEPTGAQLPGFNDSNEWNYTPRYISYDTGLQAMTDPNDWSTYPYDVSQGYTVIKEFLTAQANLSPDIPMYTAFVRQPQLTSFAPSNVSGNKVWTDGWYTSYTIACKKWALVDPVTNGASQGQILYYEPQEKFYVNLTGVGGTLVVDPNNPLLFIPDTVNWRDTPTFTEWTDLMRQNLGSAPAIVDQPIFFVENQHLVTADLNRAILSELKGMCRLCTEPTFGISQIDDHIKLTTKRLAAWYTFNQELFHDAQKIIEGTRELCYMCLYHKHALLKSNK